MEAEQSSEAVSGGQNESGGAKRKKKQLVILPHCKNEGKRSAKCEVVVSSSGIRNAVCDKMQYFRRRRKWSGRAAGGGGGLDLFATIAIFFSTVPLIVRSGKTPQATVPLGQSPRCDEVKGQDKTM